MSIVDNFLARLGYAKAAPDARPPGVMLATADGYRWEMPDGSQAERQARLYAAVTWIATAVDRCAEIGSAAVFSVAQQAGPDDDDEDLPNHEFEKLLRRPNPMQSRGEFLRDSLSWYKTTGNLYLFNNAPSEDTPPVELWIVPTPMMRPIPDGQSYIRGYEFLAPNKSPEFVEPWKIMHLKTWNPFNPFVGLSAVQSLALDAYGDIAQQKWNLKLFDKDAGKFPGVLAFKHMIANPEWDKMVRERDENWGGTNRPPVMMLRGVGDTVQWLPAALSQKEMEFLESRTFTKEEIYGKLAPGLASILAVNATEANAIAGKSTLIEFGVWPMLDQLAQKFSSDLLPLYGDDLVGTFDDMRMTNRIQDLQEQVEYAKYHTVNEVRAEYYDEEPLYLDESQVTALEDEQAVTAENRELGLAQLNGAKPPATEKKPVPFGRKAKTDEAKQPNPTKKLDPRGLMFPAQIGPATPLPGDPTKPPPAPPMPPVAPPPGNAAPDKDDVAPPQAKAAELAAWERLQVKHLHDADWQFTPRVLDFFQAGRIQAALKSARTADAVRGVFAKERGGESDVARLAAAIEKATPHL